MMQTQLPAGPIPSSGTRFHPSRSSARRRVRFFSCMQWHVLTEFSGRYSPQADERCFSYCSQSVRGRIEQREPWCRTFCLRRVFAHEVQRTLAAHDAQGQSPKARYPLPPEGQHVPSLAHVLVGETPESQGQAPQDDVRYWEEGYYLWFSKSRWATQERLDLMMTSLERQAQWDKYKQDRTEAWEQQQQQQQQAQLNNANGQPSKGDAGAEDAPKGPGGPPSSARRPFPDLRCVTRSVPASQH